MNKELLAKNQAKIKAKIGEEIAAKYFAEWDKIVKSFNTLPHQYSFPDRQIEDLKEKYGLKD